MKKTFLILVALCANFFASAQAVTKGDIIVDGYIGGPQLISRISSSVDGYELKSRGFGPFGGRVEYMVTETSSIGVESNYASTKLTATYDDNIDSYKQTTSINRFRIFPRYAIHFGSNKVDVFYHVGLGIALWSVNSEINDPSSTVAEDQKFTSSSSGPVIAFRTGIGARYFFTKNLGINADFGLGGALFTLGLSGKF